MAEQLEVKELDQVVVRFSGDSGDGMQLAGNIFSTVSATVGNGISTFPDYPADIRAPQGSLTGVSGFQVHIGAGKVYTPGDKCDVLVAMNAAALKTQYRYAKPGATIIIDTDSFGPKDLEKAQFATADYLGEMGIDPDRVIQCPLTTMVKDCLKDTGMDNKAMLKSRNMFALGLVCWLFDRDLSHRVEGEGARTLYGHHRQQGYGLRSDSCCREGRSAPLFRFIPHHSRYRHPARVVEA